MNCAEFEEVVIEIARGVSSDTVSRGAHGHAETCPRCARRLANERGLSEMAAVCRARDERRAAPPAVERGLLTAFRERRRTVRRRRSAWIASAAGGAIAAALLIAAFVAPPRPQSPRQVAARPGTPAAKTQIIAPVYRELEKPRPRALHAAKRRTVPPRTVEAASGNREIVTDFIPVVYDPDPIERGRVVRVRLPRAALVAFGFPVNELRAEEPIKADVLLGEDGLARAVRFVK
jgi:hypothetical protein